MAESVCVGEDGDIDFTGERYLPGENGLIRAEHLHRYALAREWIGTGPVLDIACGEGYGSSLLAGRAGKVYGVDIDPATIERAARRYGGNPALSFLPGSCDAIPLPDRSVETVVSFETIEHHDRHEEMLQEIKRVLEPGGLLVLSSPNKRVYSDRTGYKNPFHVRELYRDELTALLRRYFSRIRLFGQWAGLGSFIYPVDEAEGNGAALLIEETPGTIKDRTDDREAVYFLAVCSDDPERVATVREAAFFAPEDPGLRQMQEALVWGQNEMERLRSSVEELVQLVLQRDHALHRATLERDESRQAAAELEKERDACREQAGALTARLQQIESHPAYRLARRARRLLRRTDTTQG